MHCSVSPAHDAAIWAWQQAVCAKRWRGSCILGMYLDRRSNLVCVLLSIACAASLLFIRPVPACAVQVLEEELGKPTLFYRVGGSIPATGYFRQYLDILTTVFAFGLEENNVHAPNEGWVIAFSVFLFTILLSNSLACEYQHELPGLAAFQCSVLYTARISWCMAPAVVGMPGPTALESM